ncbi:MAG: hypothetical protein NUV90_02420 [Candidatus Parcubacteria bacterium]|nr:hypothetical protein [Candidatus Parcubacteria bacterium]
MWYIGIRSIPKFILEDVMTIVILGCKPEIVSKAGGEITLRFRGGSEERWLFEQAVKATYRTDAEHSAAYAEKHGITLGTPVGTD